MSHLGTRLLADRFADSDEGVNSIIQETPLHNDDPMPDTTVSVYNDTQHGWVSRGMIPLEADTSASVSFPMIVVTTQSVEYDSAIPTVESTDARTVRGTLRVIAQLVLRENDTADAAIAGLYLIRAMRGVVARFDDPVNYDIAAKRACGIQLVMCTSVSQGRVDAKLGDTLVSCAALMLSYDFLETVPLPISLH